ncbi:Lipoprotein [Comamonas aquatilis]
MPHMRLIKALTLACLTAIALTACGGNDDEQPVAPPTNPSEPAKPELRCAP